MKKKNEVQLSVIKGDKLFNENTPFVINIFSPESKDLKKMCHADLLCVIDISGSMAGSKINLVKKSLNILIELMDQNDRLGLVLFNQRGGKFFDFHYLNKENKKKLTEKINEIKAGGGTNIISGLEIAIEILKNDKDINKPNRSSSMLLLSDGCDNNFTDLEIVKKVKDLTRGQNLFFTLNTFGYGEDHDPFVMKKLANLRDGSFFYVKEYEKVAEYFGIVLGTCFSVISNQASLIIELLNKKCEIKKVFGEEYLYSHEMKPYYFNTTMLNFICGKEFTYVLEFEIKLNDVKIGEDLLSVDFLYPDEENNFCKESVIYKYCSTDKNYAKANEEYIRSQVYSIIDESLKLKENSENNKAKDILNEMKNWIKTYEETHKQKTNKIYLEDINQALDYYNKESASTIDTNIRANENNENEIKINYISDISNRVMENQTKKVCSERMTYINHKQDYYSSSSRAMIFSSSKYNNESEKNYMIQKKYKKKNCLIF